MSQPTEVEDAHAELVEFLALNPATEWLDALFVDLAGTLRGKRFARADMEKLFRGGMQFPVSSFFLDATGACLDPQGRGVSDGDPDSACRPVPGTLVPVPWSARPGAQVLMTMDVGVADRLVEPRRLAAREVARLTQTGRAACCAFELEFYLLTEQAEPGAGPAPGGRERLGQVYRMDEVEEAEALIDDVLAACRAQRIPASVTSSEYAPGQFEINLLHGADPLLAADQCVLFRRVVRSVARRHALRASFMAKPFPGKTGSGMHLHVSLLDGDGRNLFDDGGAGGSTLLGHAVAGLLHTLPDAMGLYAPNVNSFRRFEPRTFVPVNATWGHNNRSVAVRVPAGDPADRRLEMRVPGADANPYLVLTAVLAGIRHGIERSLDPGPAARGNVCERPDPALPLEWIPALERLRASAFFSEVLGPDYLSLYCETKRLEAKKFFDHIGAREYEWYL
jgi:glutamine synthetase